MLCSIGYIWWPCAFLSNCSLVEPLINPSSHMAFLRNFTSSWPRLTNARPLTHQYIALWSGVLSTKFGGHRACLRNVTSGWPQLTFAWPLTPAMHYVLVRGSSHQIWWPLGIVKQIDPSWPLHDLWPQQCITLWSGDLPTKFGGHRALSSKLTPTWPQVTPLCPLTPAMHYALVRDSSNQIWWQLGISNQFDPWLTRMTSAWPFTPAMHYAVIRDSSHQIWWP